MKSKYKFLLAMPFMLGLVWSGCSTTGTSVGAGAAVGGLTGAGVGALADPGSQGQNRFRNVVIGVAAGSAVGAGAGYILGQNAKEEREAAHELGKKDGKSSAAPVRQGEKDMGVVWKRRNDPYERSSFPTGARCNFAAACRDRSAA
jgi:hypothetical protein